jgi:hypothetical protein
MGLVKPGHWVALTLILLVWAVLFLPRAFRKPEATPEKARTAKAWIVEEAMRVRFEHPERKTSTFGKENPFIRVRGENQTILWASDKPSRVAISAVDAHGFERILKRDWDERQTGFIATELPPGDYKVVFPCESDWHGLYSELLESPLPPDGDQ